MSKAIKKIIAVAMCSVMMLSFFTISNKFSNASLTANAAISTCQTLRVGSRGTQVKYLQRNLNTLGYNCGAVDGIFGYGTRNALARFQREYINAHLITNTDGVADPGTICFMNNVCIQIQQILKRAGYNPGEIDGILGSQSINAIRNFQRDYGLLVDGIAGPRTISKFYEIGPRVGYLFLLY